MPVYVALAEPGTMGEVAHQHGDASATDQDPTAGPTMRDGGQDRPCRRQLQDGFRREVADLLRGLGNVKAVRADLTSMMLRRLIWLIVLSFSFAFIVTAAVGPVVPVVACAGVLIYALAQARGDAARRAEAAEAGAEARAAADAVIAEAEAVIAAARLRLLGGAGS